MRGPQQSVHVENIRKKIYRIRGKKVMLDHDLAMLYKVETKALKKAVRRNHKRFPEEFMFVVSTSDFDHWLLPPVTFENATPGLQHAPMAFTVQGVAMLSMILNSEQAIKVNIQIIQSLGSLRQMISANADLAKKLTALARKHDSQFRDVFAAIHALMEEPEQPKQKNGFTAKEKRLAYEACIMG